MGWASATAFRFIVKLENLYTIVLPASASNIFNENSPVAVRCGALRADSINCAAGSSTHRRSAARRASISRHPPCAFVCAPLPAPHALQPGFKYGATSNDTLEKYLGELVRSDGVRCACPSTAAHTVAGRRTCLAGAEPSTCDLNFTRVAATHERAQPVGEPCRLQHPHGACMLAASSEKLMVCSWWRGGARPTTGAATRRSRIARSTK